jgi:hypothetical protein
MTEGAALSEVCWGEALDHPYLAFVPCHPSPDYNGTIFFLLVLE